MYFVIQFILIEVIAYGVYLKMAALSWLALALMIAAFVCRKLIRKFDAWMFG